MALSISYLIIGVSAFKIGLGLAGAIVSLFGDARPTAFVGLSLILAFSAGAAFLIHGSRRDGRALHLAVCFLLIATSFSDSLAEALLSIPQLSATVLLANAIQPEAFLPFFAWCFFTDFPRVREIGPDRLSSWGRATTLGVGLFLFLITLLLGVTDVEESLPLLLVLDRQNTVSLYWLSLFVLALPAFASAFRRMNRADQEEQRRVRLLVVGFVLGSLPVTLLVLGSIVSPAFHAAVTSRPWFALSQAVVYPALLSIPLTTVYAVLARGALDIRLVIRGAIRYAFARQTVTVAFLLPVAGLFWTLFARREQPLSAAFSGLTGWAALFFAVVGFLGLRFRTRALRALDRRFFRDQYDAHRILSALVRGVRDIQTVDRFGEMLSREIDRALHPRFVFFMVSNPLSRLLEPPGKELPPLPVGSVIAESLRRVKVPVAANESGDWLAGPLSTRERHWMDDSDADLLVPLVSTDGELLGLALLGEKKSELPYSKEDRSLLVDIAAAGAETLHRKLLPELTRSLTPPEASIPDPHRVGVLSAQAESARECPECGQLGSYGLARCPVCGAEMLEAPVPFQLRGAYQLEKRIGRGGMGIVYRALDLELNRPVAVKTLLRSDPDLAKRLRREARAMASVSHANLATIYGAETWMDRPLIMVEFFDLGTLEDRLAKGPLAGARAIEMGLALASGVEHLHDLGMLHRDIKPSNIAFGGPREPKLLDFGLIQFLPEFGPVPAAQEASGEGSEDRGSLLDMSRAQTLSRPRTTQSGRVRGTLAYLSPEVLAGDAPGVESDVWSLSVVLYEAVAGVNPFAQPGGAARTVAPDLRTFCRDCPPTFAETFSRLLSPDPSRRPGTVRELRQQLHTIT